MTAACGVVRGVAARTSFAVGGRDVSFEVWCALRGGTRLARRRRAAWRQSAWARFSFGHCERTP
jgi:hypothetical protein